MKLGPITLTFGRGAAVSAAAARGPSLDDYLLHGSAGWAPEDRTAADVARRIPPQQVDALLKGAGTGEPVWLADLYNAMIRTWPRLAKNIGEMRRAAAAAPWTLTPWTDADGNVPDEAAGRKAVVEAALFNMAPAPGTLEKDFRALTAAMAEDELRGVGVHELLWHIDDRGDGAQVSVRAAQQVHASYYNWRRPGGGTVEKGGAGDALLYKAGGRRGGALTAWPEHQFLIHLAPGWNDHPALAGTLGTLAMWWVGANYGPQWLFDYAQSFGQPILWANYPAGDVRARDALFAMLGSVQGKRRGAFPTGAELKIIESAKSAGELPQKLLIEHADTVCDILTLGQTLSTETGGTGSQALGNVHAGVKHDILCAVLCNVAGVLNRQAVPAILKLNFGDTKFAPVLTHGLEDPRDDEALARRDEILLRAGVPLPRKWFYERHQVPVPADDEEVVGKATPPEAKAPAPKEEPTEEPGAEVNAAAALTDLTEGEAGEAELATLTEIFTRTLEHAAARGHTLAAQQMEALTPKQNEA